MGSFDSWIGEPDVVVPPVVYHIENDVRRGSSGQKEAKKYEAKLRSALSVIVTTLHSYL